MPGKDRIKKRSEQYKEKSTAFFQISERDPFYLQKWTVASSLAALTQMIDSFGPYDSQSHEKPNPPRLSTAEITALMELYRNTMQSLDELNQKEKEALVVNPRNSRDRNKNTRLNTEIEQNARLRTILNKDYETFRRIHGEISTEPKEYTLREIYDRSRVISDYSIKENSVDKSESGALSERIPMTLIRPGKSEKRGFFTVDKRSKALPHEHDVLKEELKKYRGQMDFLTPEIMDRLVDHIMQTGNPKEEKLLEKLLKSPEPKDFENFEAYRLKLIGGFRFGKLQLIEKIDTPAKLHMFSDLLHKYIKTQNARLIHTNTGINPEGRFNRRNTAMSQMADFLGCPELLARSENVKLNLDGKIVRGSFMEEATGGDPRYLEKNPGFFRTNPYSLENLKLKKQVATLQALDYLCGNTDRHSGNIFYQFKENEDGSVTLDGIQGIDNDVSFGLVTPTKRYYMSMVPTSAMRVIPSELGIQILNLTEDKLRQVLYGCELSDAELHAMGKRLKNLQDAIVKGSMKYSDGYGKCQLLDNEIKMVPDDELELIPYSELCVTSPDKRNGNTFARVNAWTKSGSGNIAAKKKQFESAYKKAVYQFTFGNCQDSLKLIDELSKDTVWHQTSTNQYNVMLRRMTELQEQMTGFNDPMPIDPMLLAAPQHSESLMAIRTAMIDTLAVVNQYIQYKDSKVNGEDWRTDPNRFNPGFEPGKTERRYKHAIHCKEFLTRKLAEYDRLMEPLLQYTDFCMQETQLDRTYRRLKETQEDDYFDSDNYHNYINEKRNSHKGRVEVLLREDMNRILMSEDLNNVRKNRLQSIINYGFGINSVSEVNRSDVDTSLEKLISTCTPEEQKHLQNIITPDRDRALKRSLALLMIRDQEPNPGEALKKADIMIETPSFGRLFTEIRDELIPPNATLSLDIQLPEAKKIQGYIQKLSSILSKKNRSASNNDLQPEEDQKSKNSSDSMKASVSDSAEKESSSGGIIKKSGQSSKISFGSEPKKSPGTASKKGSDTIRKKPTNRSI